MIDIIAGVALENGVSIADVTRRGRATDRLWLIQAQAARRLRGRHLSMQEIGKILGRKHHTTVMSMLYGGKKKNG